LDISKSDQTGHELLLQKPTSGSTAVFNIFDLKMLGTPAKTKQNLWFFGDVEALL